MAFTDRTLFSLCVLILSAMAVQAVIFVGPDVVNEENGGLYVTILNSLLVETWNFTYETSSLTAEAGEDFTATSPAETVSVPGGNLIYNLFIPITDDKRNEGDETFLLRLESFSTGDPGVDLVVTITDDEGPPIPLSQPGNITVTEGTDHVTINISRTNSSTEAFNVSVDTIDNTAISTLDYDPLDGSMVTFDHGEESQLITIHIIDDSEEESVEEFAVIFHGLALVDNVTVVVSIHDNDVAHALAPVNFHCGRGDSQPCLNNGVCNHGTDGTCDCSISPGFQGVNCGIETSNVTTGCGCVNGTCVNTGNGDVCICDPGYAGHLCDRKAYFHQCEFNGFSVCITPFSVDTFNGLVYVVGKDDVSECNLDLAPIPSDPDDDIVDWCMGYAAFIPFNGSCGELGPNVVNEMSSYVLRLRVQYSSGQLRSTDEEVILSCQYNNDNGSVWNGMLSINHFSSKPSIQSEKSLYTPASLLITKESGRPVDGTLSIGEHISICISVLKVRNLKGILIRRIVGNNTRSGTNFRDLLLYKDQCVPDTAKGIITELPYWEHSTEKHTMCLQMEVFYFSHDSDLTNPALGLVIEIFVYEDPVEISMASCGSRRKRQTGSGTEMSVGTTLHIRNQHGRYQQVSGLVACSCTHWMILATISLGVIIGTMVVVVIIVVLTITAMRPVCQT